MYLRIRSSVFSLFFAVFWLVVNVFGSERAAREEDHLTPYRYQHGSHLSYREIRECHPVEFGDVPHEDFPADQTDITDQSVVQTKLFRKGVARQTRTVQVHGHYSIVLDPVRTVSVLEPSHEGGCGHKSRETVAGSAKQKKCLVAINAGYFNTHTGECLGNIVSDGRKVQDYGGIQNAHFGIKQNGTIFTGYVSEEEVKNGAGEFLQLVGGVGWLIRNGQSFINVSKTLECEETEETGPMDYFADVLSARTAIGHDNQGRVIIVQVDGRTGDYGISMSEMTEILRELNVENAINLDGGGSATFVMNGTVVNYPSDICTDNFSLCDRPVSTIVCIHEPYCDPEDCNGHGECINGKCVCDRFWSPSNCKDLLCDGNNCSQHGNCTENGCICDNGWMGENCSESCPREMYGENCQQRCLCMNNSTCDAETGICKCGTGYRGRFCEKECPYGFYGHDCMEQCFCDESCGCDTVTGQCKSNWNSSSAQGNCIVKNLIKQQKLMEKEENSKWSIIIIGIVAGIAIISLVINVVLLWCSCTCSCRSVPLCRRRRYQKRHMYRIAGDVSSDEEQMSMTIRNSQRN